MKNKISTARPRVRAEDLVKQYYSDFSKALNRITVTGRKGSRIDFAEAVARAVRAILDQKQTTGRMYFIGNGASAAISSHQAADFAKAGGVPAHCFNDPALLTCMGNDYGYKHVFEKPVELFVGADDILVAISSSGASENILRAVKMARIKKAQVITLSGFKQANPLRQLGDLNFHVPSFEYGHVEVAHHSICHCILDTLIAVSQKS